VGECVSTKQGYSVPEKSGYQLITLRGMPFWYSGYSYGPGETRNRPLAAYHVHSVFSS
jgi:hypothetical protein